MIKSTLAGIAQTIRFENAMRLQQMQLTRPSEVKLKVAKVLRAIDAELEADKDLKAKYESINLSVPE